MQARAFSGFVVHAMCERDAHVLLVGAEGAEGIKRLVRDWRKESEQVNEGCTLAPDALRVHYNEHCFLVSSHSAPISR